MNAEEVLKRYLSFKKARQSKTERLMDFIAEHGNKTFTDGENEYIKKGIERIKELENLENNMLDLYVHLTSRINIAEIDQDYINNHHKL